MICLLSLSLASCTKRKPEEIDYAPNSPCDPYPADSAANINHTTLDVTLSWKAYDQNTGDILTYEVFFDTINPPMTSIASGLTSPNCFVDSLSYNTTYYWKVFATDQEGTSSSSPVWRFTTLPHPNSAPAIPAYLYPVDNAAWQYPTLNFAVYSSDPDGSSDTLYYDLYLGVSPQPSLTLFRNDPASSWGFTGLEYTTTYYWRVAVRDNHYAYTYGPVSSFTTRDCPWFYKQELPSPRYGFGTAVVGGKIYVIGGTDGINYLNEVLEYDPLLDAWTRKADMPTPRSDLAVTVWDNKIYALGGASDTSSNTNNEAYDPLLDSWTVMSPSPGGFMWSTANTVGDKILFMGSSIFRNSILTGVFEYLPAANVWWDTVTFSYDTVWTDTTYTTFDSIITNTCRTSLRTTLPQSKIIHCSAVYNHDLYVIGGMTSSGSFPAGVDVYHPETNNWTAAADMIGTGSAAAAVTANGSIYVIGGYDGTCSKRVRKYDPLADAWFIRSDLQTGRWFLGAAFLNDHIYAIGGISPFWLSSVEEYQLDLDPKNIPIK